MRNKSIIFITVQLVILLVVSCNENSDNIDVEIKKEDSTIVFVDTSAIYGFRFSEFKIDSGRIKQNQGLAHIYEYERY